MNAALVLVRLYAAAPEATFLVTSRAVLRIRGERVYELGGLSLGSLADRVSARPPTVAEASRSEAVQLFVERARAARGDFDLSQHQKHAGKSMEVFDEEVKAAFAKWDDARKLALVDRRIAEEQAKPKGGMSGEAVRAWFGACWPFRASNRLRPWSSTSMRWCWAWRA